MAIKRLFSLTLLLFIPALLVCFPRTSRGADTDFVLDLIRNIEGIQTTFPEWQVSNISNARFWPGLAFNGDRIRVIGLTPSVCCLANPRTFSWKGRWPSSVSLLTELEEYYMTNAGLVYGDYPAGILSLPTLRVFEVEGALFSLPLPDRWPVQLERFSFSRGNFISSAGPGQLPALAAGPTRITHFECLSCGLTCPLPQWLVDKINSGSLLFCNLRGNKFAMIDGKICGQIAADTANCIMMPYITTPPPSSFFETSVPDFKFENDRVLAEVHGNAVYTFSKYISKRTNQLAVYRDEYTGTIFQPWIQLNATGDGDSGTRVFELPKFGTWRTISADEYRVDASYGNGALVVEYTFSFRGPQKDSVGFDLVSYSILDQPNRFGRTVGLVTQFVLKIQHSDMVPLSCSKASPTSFFYVNCSSDVLSSPLLAFTPSLEFFLQYRNSRVVAELKVPTLILVDGVSGVVDQFTDVIVHAEPYGHVDPIEKSKLLFPGQYFQQANRTKAPPAEQHIAVLALIYVPRWTRNITYDPEVRIELLFDPEELAPEAGVSESSNAVLIGVVVSVVVVVLIAGTVAVVIKVVFPYRAAAAEAASLRAHSTEIETNTDESPNSSNATNRWSTPSKPMDLRNTAT